jgi:GNAT superfamily N-acetyltransferase
MADERSAALSVGDRDPELAEVLDKGLDEYNFAATGTSAKDQGSFSVKVTGPDGEIIGGLTAWTWAGLCRISMLWVHPDHRNDGWGAKILAAAEAEARRRGCDRACVSSFTVQARGSIRSTGMPNGPNAGHPPVEAKTSICSSACSWRGTAPG